MTVLGDSLIKKPYIKLPYSDSEIQDLIQCADPVTGPMFYLENHFYIQHATRGRLKFVPFDYQVELVDNYHSNRYSINIAIV